MNTGAAVSTSLRLRDFICIGAAKCGSTTLWELLDRHENICLPDTKELHFFDNCVAPTEQDAEQYASHFREAAPDCCVGECTPGYLYMPGCCESMRRLIPDVRLIVILRNPVDRAWSSYWYACQHGLETLSFSDAIAAEERRIKRNRTSLRWLSYVSRGHYLRQLLRYEAAFSREQICVIFFEELIEDPRQTLGPLYRHLALKVPEDPHCYDLPWHLKQTVHYRWLLARALAIRACNVTMNKPGLIRRPVQRAARMVKEQSVVPGKPKMPTPQREQLNAIFRKSNLELETWLGRQLPWS